MDAITWPIAAIILGIIGTLAGLAVKVVDNIFLNRKSNSTKTNDASKADKDENFAAHQRMQDQIQLVDRRIDLVEKDLEVMKSKQSDINSGFERLEKKIDALIEKLLGKA